MPVFYSIGIFLYGLAARVFALFNHKAALWVRGRKNLFPQLKSWMEGRSNIVWFHAASLGEFEQGRPVIEELRRRGPSFTILLTFFSPSGCEVRKDYAGADLVVYLPQDTHRNAARFISIVQPVAVYFIKYEFWYFYLKNLKKRNIPVFLLSAKFRSDQLFFKWYGNWYRNMLNYFNHIFVQDNESRQLLQQAGYNRVTVSGDTRFDRVAEIAAGAQRNVIAEKFVSGRFTIICGSTWEADEDLLVCFIQNCSDNVCFIIAPHQVDEGHVRKLVENLKTRSLRYSEAGGCRPEEFRVLVIDNVGILSSLYQYGNVAYIGGGFGAGIHNILEAATFGLPVVFGPNHIKFREATDLIALGGAFSIKAQEELNDRLQDFIHSTINLEKASSTARNYVVQNTGATNIILDYTLTDRK